MSVCGVIAAGSVGDIGLPGAVVDGPIVPFGEALPGITSGGAEPCAAGSIGAMPGIVLPGAVPGDAWVPGVIVPDEGVPGAMRDDA